MMLHLLLMVCLALTQSENDPNVPAESQDGSSYLIKADVVYPSAGRAPIRNGAVLIRNGKIAAVEKGLNGTGCDEIFSCEGDGYLTTGLIDGASRTGLIRRDSWAEQTDEVIPQLENFKAVDLSSKHFKRLAAQGVTTVYITPDPASVIGCRGAIVKTGGPGQDRVVLRAADVKATLGPEGWRRGAQNSVPRGTVDFRTRRPTTRMGMAWVFRKAFYDALDYKNSLSSPDADPGSKDPALETLVEVLEGKIPFRIQAREDIDIWSAIRLCKEFDLTFVLEEGIEAYRCLPELKAGGIPVFFGPICVETRGDRSRSGEQLRPCLNSAGLLKRAGVPFALTAGGLDGSDALPHQAGHAIRFGLDFDDALEAVTATPAELLGINDRVGRLAAGFDADLVLWNAKPFSPQAKPVLVMINGRIVHCDGDEVTRTGGEREVASKGPEQDENREEL